VYACPAVGFEGDEFFNLVVGFDTDETPQAVDEALHAIEYEHGRVRGAQRFAPRSLDLDILTYDNLILHEGKLRLPRGEIIRYAFVLKPLADLAPDARHPELGASYAELWASFDAREQPLTAVDFPLP
jgi:2-amino-4-hydroxy-6-hydroxymethyldihydropteridine diphosphokinase